MDSGVSISATHKKQDEEKRKIKKASTPKGGSELILKGLFQVNTTSLVKP